MCSKTSCRLDTLTFCQNKFNGICKVILSKFKMFSLLSNGKILVIDAKITFEYQDYEKVFK